MLTNAAKVTLELNLSQLKHHPNAHDAMLAPVSYCELTLTGNVRYNNTCVHVSCMYHGRCMSVCAHLCTVCVCVLYFVNTLQLVGPKTVITVILSRWHPSHHKITYQDFYNLLQRYATCHQRYGK